MLVNRTLEYKKFARRRDTRFTPLSTANVRASLSDVRRSISRLGITQEKHTMPSFSSKRKKKDEIDEIKKCISDQILHAEKSIGEALKNLSSKVLTECMHGYFFGQLKAAIRDYRGLQQKFLKNIDTHEEAECEDEENESNTMLLENVKDLRKSIYDLTSVLLDMKMAVGQQSLQIDRLDFYLDSINFYLEGANNELEKIPASRRRVKDKVMYSMLLLSIVLVLMSMIKITRSK
ncbi:hypothetical protein [Encephalitozoon cuniculi GB-M1]|uniref:t-SNARE coiled-coil homology domain-containing protein n=2 Tax=Encephalitozoon cuniculi TaxID=6035 RepID=Q8SVH6_ENCCU|nr:uncharacterized protein ECU05_1220 [Encephalitozoon cuniculi GB-M1]AGE95446.1 hypothetical protein ECU05_1220 [Encephalitozoon cuniculi]KMV66179.1 putative t-SNARE complex subunit [Encephalitozoon cuniculi EcunIII-L]UYI27919.1 hypothetical protein J0A71_08g18080 [Encephalitozoon cuniculi]CAD26642.1 hypothetical protein [Encephalitozoon cuniculi GB-M1]